MGHPRGWGAVAIQSGCLPFSSPVLCLVPAPRSFLEAGNCPPSFSPSLLFAHPPHKVPGCRAISVRNF